MQSGNNKQFCIATFKSDITICLFSSCSFLHPLFLFFSLPLFFVLPLFLSLHPSLYLSLYLSLSLSFSLCFSLFLSISLPRLSLSFCNCIFYLCVWFSIPSPISIFSLSLFNTFCNSLCFSPLLLSILSSFSFSLVRAWATEWMLMLLSIAFSFRTHRRFW